MSHQNVRLACIAGLILLSVGLYAPNLNDYFLGDDFDLIHSFYDQPLSYFVHLLWDDESGSVWDYLCYAEDSGCPDPETHGFLRPFKMWLFALDYQIWGVNSFGYHVTSTLMFLGTVLFSFLIMEHLAGGRRGLAFTSAAIVAVHPIFAGVVPSITYREEILASTLALGCVYVFLKFRSSSADGGLSRSAWVSYLLYTLALLTKESAIVTVGLLVGFDALEWLLDRSSRSKVLDRLRYYVPFLPILAVYFTLRLIAFRSFTGGHAETDFTSIEGLISFHSILFSYLFTAPMLYFHRVPMIGPLVGLVGLALVAILVMGRQKLDRDYLHRLLFLGPIWYAASTALSHGIYFSPRHVVFPVIGMVLFAMVLLEGAAKVLDVKRSWIPAVAIAIAAIAFLPPTIQMSQKYNQASDVVQAILKDIERETAHLPDGSRVLIQNLPESPSGPPPFFRLALKSALQQPFNPSNIAQRLIIDTVPTEGHYDLALRF